MTTRAAIYARISKDLAQEGLGIARQLSDCRAYAKKKGYVVVLELKDNDISASGLKQRPSYLQLRELMETRSIDLAVVYSMDRLHRSMAELVDYIELSRRTDVGIVSVTGGSINLATADGRLQAHIFGAFAAAEREKTQERIKRKHAELAQSGKWPGQRVYGYRADASVVKKESDVIKDLCARLLAGEGYNSIASDLNTRGIPTLTGAKWRASTITGIARSARIAGHREHKGVISFRNAWEAIIDEETSMLLRSRLMPGRSGGTRGGPRKHLLTGLLVCGKCNHGMVRGLAGKQKTPNYRCPANQGSGACGGTSISLTGAEAFLSEALFVAHDEAVDDDQQSDDLEVWAEKRKALESRQKTLAELLGKGLMEPEEWVLASAANREELKRLPEPRVKPHRKRITGDELRSAWPDIPGTTKRALLDDAFIRIVVMPRRIVTGQKTFDPGRLVPEWRR
ncbi:recombinase family protein [Arthrobacter sp. CAN_C5]|uniref:recombinase family protein n=1 Tax=Arthrobacter sp. CAN_C5 TaxID=2760706 RepID=UPI001AE122FD|nr:recombinase family protein [Arthrobacter sp. CAN_C5]MBP2215985.1 DNA invertase Pin-like site-specific DNA recombinase [Arthrobacter sp. CAN_C5]